MRFMNFIFILFILSTITVNAEVFKCKSPSGEIIYQPSPCPINEVPLGQLKIKGMTLEEREKAKALREAEEKEEAAYETEKAKAEKQRQIEMARQQELELGQRRIKAQEDAANAARNRMWRPGMYYPPPMNQ